MIERITPLRDGNLTVCRPTEAGLLAICVLNLRRKLSGNGPRRLADRVGAHGLWWFERTAIKLLNCYAEALERRFIRQMRRHAGLEEGPIDD